MRLSSLVSLSAVFLASACRLDPARIAGHALVADDGGKVAADGLVMFAVVGNTRDPVPAVDNALGGIPVPGAADAILGDIAARAGKGGPRFLLHLGDAVRISTSSEWNRFSARTRGLLQPHAGGDGVPGLLVAGDRDAAGDDRYRGLGAAFPGTGADIGYNRVATWSSFDIASAGKVWRVLVLDSGKERLGSRWTEQRNYVQRVVKKGEYDGILIFMHDPVLDLAGREADMNRGGGPAELLDWVEESVGLLKVRAVFGAGHHAAQVILPDGPFGAAHIGAGGGGAPAEPLRRWGGADQAGRNEDLQLEPVFDLALMTALDIEARRIELPPVLVDQAKARGSYAGFTGAYAPAALPVTGWWQVSVYGETLDLLFRFRAPDGTFTDLYRLTLDPKDGWKPSRPAGAPSAPPPRRASVEDLDE
jgi:hypothetical protein